MWTWHTSYSRNGDYLVLNDAKWWTILLEWIGVPLIEYAITYPLGNWLLGRMESGTTEIYREPLPPELYDAWWRDDEESDT